eukprot:2480812-Rhodomonas_salina.1
MSTRHIANHQEWEDGDVGHLREGVVYRYHDLKRKRSVDSDRPVCKQCKPDLQKYLLPVIEKKKKQDKQMSRVVVDNSKWEKRRFLANWHRQESFE